jgi:hypothetical protein
MAVCNPAVVCCLFLQAKTLFEVAEDHWNFFFYNDLKKNKNYERKISIKKN